MAKNKDIARLQALEVAHRSAAAPSIPKNYVTPSKYSDKTANGLTKCIIDWLRFNGHQSERINTQGRVVDKTKVVKDVLGCRRSIGSVEWQKGSGTKGSADISAIIGGRSVKIEVKSGRDVQSKQQKAYQQDVEKAGGVYFIAKDFSSFCEWFDTNFGGPDNEC